MVTLPAGRSIAPRRRLSLARRLALTIGRLVRHRFALLGIVLLALEIGAALLAPWLAGYAPNAIDYRAMLQAPSFDHLLGTDDLGRDILSRLIHGGRLSLTVSTLAVLMAVSVGVPLGLIAGYVGGAVDEVLMRVLDSIMALPPLVLALMIAAVLGPGLINAMIAIAIVAVPVYTRLMRGQVLSLKHNDYIAAAQSVGVPAWLILFRHVLPNAINPVIVQASLGIGFAIITESSLSFIGLGAQPPISTWGSMVQVGFQFLELAPWFVLAPATAIFVAVLGFNMLGEGLRDALDPTTSTRL
ncbi:MAG: ABC transporter permease [Alphaproteobacteria bacterium]|nr:ABC transporter permease [Alphaproteobacteria bacterium]